MAWSTNSAGTGLLCTCETYYKLEGVSNESKFDHVHGIVSLRNRLAY